MKKIRSLLLLTSIFLLVAACNKNENALEYIGVPFPGDLDKQSGQHEVVQLFNWENEWQHSVVLNTPNDPTAQIIYIKIEGTAAIVTTKGAEEPIKYRILCDENNVIAAVRNYKKEIPIENSNSIDNTSSTPKQELGFEALVINTETKKAGKYLIEAARCEIQPFSLMRIDLKKNR